MQERLKMSLGFMHIYTHTYIYTSAHTYTYARTHSSMYTYKYRLSGGKTVSILRFQISVQLKMSYAGDSAFPRLLGATV